MTLGISIKEKFQSNVWLSSIVIGLICGALTPIFHKSIFIVVIGLSAPVISVIITKVHEGENKYLKLFLGATSSLLIAFTLFSLYMFFAGNEGLQHHPSRYVIQSLKVFGLGIFGCMLLTFFVTRRK
jgi:hypothetical protein